jgi:GxxExxY protein
MLRPVDRIERIAHGVIGAAIEAHRLMGPGLLEGVYRDCLAVELGLRGFSVERDVRVPIIYKGQSISTPLKLDLLVDRQVVVEVKAVESLHPVHEAQVITYLTLSGHQAGLLMNFNEILLKNGLRRFDHPDRYRKKSE